MHLYRITNPQSPQERVLAEATRSIEQKLPPIEDAYGSGCVLMALANIAAAIAINTGREREAAQLFQGLIAHLQTHNPRGRA